MKTAHIIILFGLVYCACAGSDFDFTEDPESIVDGGGGHPPPGRIDFTEDKKEKEKGTIVGLSKLNPDLYFCTIDRKELCVTEETCNYYCISYHASFLSCEDGDCCCEYHHIP